MVVFFAQTQMRAVEAEGEEYMKARQMEVVVGAPSAEG